MTFMHVDRNDLLIRVALATAPVYKKQGLVKARPAVAGEKIVTVLKSGQTETDNLGVYQAKGYCKAIENPFFKPVEIMSEWGSPQNGDEHCLFAIVSDADGATSGDPYIIEAAAFKETYKLKQSYCFRAGSSNGSGFFLYLTLKSWLLSSFETTFCITSLISLSESVRSKD